jgi:hypothetical protein
MAADDAFQAELVRLYGRQACNARYDARGKSTPELRRLCNDKRAADYAVHCAWCETRGDTPGALILVNSNGRDSLCHA